MSDRYYLTLDCAYCGQENTHVRFAPSESDTETFICQSCGEECVIFMVFWAEKMERDEADWISIAEIREQLDFEVIQEFVQRVNVRAEANIEKTGKLEGAHYAAMKTELNILEKRVKGEEG